jgi:hypothetical protein
VSHSLNKLILGALLGAAVLTTLSACERDSSGSQVLDEKPVSRPKPSLKCVKKVHNGLYFSRFLGGSADDAQREVELLYGRGKCQYDDKDGYRTLDAFTVAKYGYVDDSSSNSFVPSDSTQFRFVLTKEGKLFAVRDEHRVELGTIAKTKEWGVVTLENDRIKKLRLLVLVKDEKTGKQKARAYDAEKDKRATFAQRFVQIGI